jgi:hypothetical protein
MKRLTLQLLMLLSLASLVLAACGGGGQAKARVASYIEKKVKVAER